MLMLLDNRAALPDELGDLDATFCPTERNATVVPRALVPQKFPVPGTPEWARMNRRRGELIRRKVRGSLSPVENEELEWLQRETLAAVDRTFPRPTVDLRALAELEKRLREGPKQETP